MLFNNIVLMDTFGIVFLSVGIPVGLFLVAFVAFFLYRMRFHSNYENLNNRFSSISDSLTKDCASSLKRLKVLGSNNEKFQSYYEEKKYYYEETLKKISQEVSQCLTSLNELIQAKNYKDSKEVEEEVKNKIESFDLTVSKFRTDLSSLLQQDTLIHSALSSTQIKYRNITDFFLSHGVNKSDGDLFKLRDSYNNVCTFAKKNFELFNTLADRGDYDKAQLVLDKLNRVFDGIILNMQEMPSIQLKIDNTIPNDLMNLDNEYHALIADGFAYEQFEYDKNLLIFKEIIDTVQNKLLVLDSQGCSDDISLVLKGISTLHDAFVDEREAKEYYDKNCQRILGSVTFNLSKEYSDCMNALEKYKKVYELDYKYVKRLTDLNLEIETIEELKRDIDDSNNTKDKQPYVSIIKKMKYMDKLIAEVKQAIKEHNEYIISLCEKANTLYKNTITCYETLKSTEVIIRDINVTSLSDIMKKQAQDYYAGIKQVMSVLCTAPISVNKAEYMYSSLNVSIVGFVNSIKSIDKDAKDAEEKYVKANIFRLDYSDVEDSLLKAEKAFLQYNFKECSLICDDIIRNYSLGYE